MTFSSWHRRVRRVFSAEEKRRIVEESKRPGISVVAVARRYRVSTALLFRWRRQERQGLFDSPAAASRGVAHSLDGSDTV